MTDNKLADALQTLLLACDDSDSAMYGTLGVSFVRDVAQAALAEHDAKTVKSCFECGDGAPGFVVRCSSPDGSPSMEPCRTCFERDAGNPSGDYAKAAPVQPPANGEAGLDRVAKAIAARLKAAQEPVAWSIELADGTLAEIGWLDMRLFESARAIGTLSPGAHYVFAYTATPALPEVSDEDARIACMANLHPLTEPSSTEIMHMLASLIAYRARLMAKGVQS